MLPPECCHEKGVNRGYAENMLGPRQTLVQLMNITN